MRRRCWLLLSILLVGSLRAPAQEAPAEPLAPARAAAVDAAVRTQMAKDEAVGVALGLIENGRIIYLRGYGLADREQEKPVTTATLFRWASCAKPVTAVAAMQLVEQGRLDLDADARRYVPEFPDKGVPITTRQLLSHQGGIVHYSNGKVVRTERRYDMPHPFEDVVLALDLFKESPLICRPGEKYSYTTHGYILASAVVQRAGAQKFADQVRARISGPLGMTTFQPDYEWVAIPDRTEGYRKLGAGIGKSRDGDVSWKLGGGGYLSNIGDFARFVAGLANRKLVSEQTERLMWTPQKLADGTATTYGLGFNIGGASDRRVISHGGAQEKTRTLFRLYAAQRRGLVLMTNSEWVRPDEYAGPVLKALGVAAASNP